MIFHDPSTTPHNHQPKIWGSQPPTPRIDAPVIVEFCSWGSNGFSRLSADPGSSIPLKTNSTQWSAIASRHPLTCRIQLLNVDLNFKSEGHSLARRNLGAITFGEFSTEFGRRPMFLHF